MKWIIMTDVTIPIREPDGRIWADHESVEYDGDLIDDYDEAVKRITSAKSLNPGQCFWLSGREDD